MNTHSGESFALIASCRHFGGSQGGRNSWGGRSVRGGCDYRGGGL